MKESRVVASKRTNFNHLHYFHIVATEGSLSQASRAIDVSQSTLSEQLKALESHLGETLFERHVGGMKLTAPGRRLLEYTGPMFHAAERMHHSFFESDGVPPTSLQVGVASSISRSFTAEYFVPLFESDETYIRIRQGDTLQLSHDLLAQDIDLIVSDTESTGKQLSGLKSVVIDTPSLVAVASKAFTDKRSTFPFDFSAAPFLTYTHHTHHRWEVDRFFIQQGIEPNIIGETDDVLTMLSAVEQGICFAVLPTSVAATGLSEKRLTLLSNSSIANVEVRATYIETDPSELVLNAVERLRTSRERALNLFSGMFG